MSEALKPRQFKEYGVEHEIFGYGVVIDSTDTSVFVKFLSKKTVIELDRRVAPMRLCVDREAPQPVAPITPPVEIKIAKPRRVKISAPSRVVRLQRPSRAGSAPRIIEVNAREENLIIILCKQGYREVE